MTRDHTDRLMERFAGLTVDQGRALYATVKGLPSLASEMDTARDAGGV
jgi:hypothetical protein